jgi:hypothetical protein
MDITADDFFNHDLFIITIKDYNKLYVGSRLDDYIATNRAMPINTVDPSKFQKALRHRLESRDKRKKDAKANEASTPTTSRSSNNNNNEAFTKGIDKSTSSRGGSIRGHVYGKGDSTSEK